MLNRPVPKKVLWLVLGAPIVLFVAWRAYANWEFSQSPQAAYFELGRKSSASNELRDARQGLKKPVQRDFGPFEIYDVEQDGSYIKGSLVNAGDEHFAYVQVRAKVFNKANAVIDTPFAISESIGPRSRWDFRIPVSRGDEMFYFVISDVESR
jgi:hypothetical protein